MKLNNQEIRNCIYGGSFNYLLKELDQFPPWRRLNKMRPGSTYRFTKQEIMLRFFSFLDNRHHYEGHLAKFLNDYMHEHQDAPESWIEEKRQLFLKTVGPISEGIFDSKPPPKLSITVLEALLVGVGANISAVYDFSATELRRRYRLLTGHAEFSEGALREGLSKKLRVIERLNTAISIFSA